MIRIGIDAYPLTNRTKAGIAYFIEVLLKHLFEIDTKNEYVLYNHRGNVFKLPNQNVRFAEPLHPAKLARTSTLWMLFYAKQQLIKDKIDIFWGTHELLPSSIHTSIKTVLTVHDLTWYFYPRTMAIDNYIVHRLLINNSLRNAHRIITDSSSVAHELMNIPRARVPGKKISVVYGGVGSEFQSFDKEKSKIHVSQTSGISKDYILFVGTIEPRKNITGLLKAYKILKTKYNIPHQLVLAGAHGWKTSSIKKLFVQLDFKKDDVKCIGYVALKELVKLYSGADIFVFPSIYEGFGLPVLEAMACGTPVIASNIPVFQELFDDAALLVNTSIPEHLADAMNRLLTDQNLTGELVQKGNEQIKQYSWKKSAAKLLSIFQELNESTMENLYDPDRC